MPGVQCCTASPTRTSTRLSLDLHGLRVAQVTVDGARGEVLAPQGPLRVRLRSGIPREQAFSVTVQYSGHPAPLRSRTLGDAGWEELTDGVIVAGQPHGAPSWFPCNDRPSNKASYRTHDQRADHLPRDLQRHAGLDEHASASSTTWVYDQPEPMATYLATVQIGRYQLLELDAVVPLYAAFPARLVPKYDAAFGAAARDARGVHRGSSATTRSAATPSSSPRTTSRSRSSRRVSRRSAPTTSPPTGTPSD